jgi:hypothetical protein
MCWSSQKDGTITTRHAAEDLSQSLKTMLEEQQPLVGTCRSEATVIVPWETYQPPTAI